MNETTYIMCGVKRASAVAEIIRRAILRARVNVNVKYSAARLYGPRIKGQRLVGPKSV